VPDLAARAYFILCLALGRLLRSARYATALIVDQDGEPRVRKHRRFYAPVLVGLASPLASLLDTGVEVLPQRRWEEREDLLYRTLHGTRIRVDAGGVLVLPYLAGRTLAALLDDPELTDAARRTAIERSAVALAAFHASGFTHGDAMAENVLVDRDAGTAHWFDFETMHDEHRSLLWRRADDVRALLATCLVRTVRAKHADTLALVLDAYADPDVAHAVAASFGSVWRRSLTFHLAQARLQFDGFRETGRVLHERTTGDQAIEPIGATR
jgi:hypothetical protein